jgi:hypothetical protein
MSELTKNRIAATSVAVCLLIYAGCCLGAGEYFFWRTVSYVGLAMGLIWFGPALGQYTGRCGVQFIDDTTPGIMIVSVGWILLLLTPLVVSATKVRMAMGW